MSIELGIIIAVVSGAVSLASFFIGRQTAAKSEGQLLGLMSADIKHIGELMHKVETNMQSSQKRIHERIDEIGKTAHDAMQTASAANLGQQSAHKRIDELKNSVK